MKIKPHVKKKGRKPMNQAVFDKIAASKTKGLIITKKEWKLKTPAGHHILFKYLKKHYKVESLADGSGWYITKARS